MKRWQTVAKGAALFCGLVALLLLLNYLQIRKYNPLESNALAQLIGRLAENPADEALQTDIRNLDLLARKAYFTNRWQVRTGSYLLLLGAVVFVIAARMRNSLLPAIEEPSDHEADEWKQRALARTGILIAGFLLLVLALAASFATTRHLDRFGSETATLQEIILDSPVEVIEVGKESDSAAAGSELPAGAPVAVPADTVVAVPAAAADSTVAAEGAAPPGAAQFRANFPSFRGPFGNGVSAHTNIPVDFDGPSGRNIRWKVAVPLSGFNSPVIWGDRLFITGANGQQREVYCYDRYGGKLLWTARADHIPGSPATAPRTTDDTGLAAPSVTTDGIRVYALFGTGDALALDMEGKRIWARNLGVPDNHYGHSSSLLVWQNLVYFQYDTNSGRKLIALGASDGKTVWETNRNVKVSWASPILARIGGSYQVVLSADPLVAGYDALTGREIWAVNAMMGEVGPSPAYGEGLVFAANEYARLAAINPATRSIEWEQDEYMPEVASPVVSQGLLFVATSYGVLACYDAKTGEKKWEHDGGVGYYSSPVVADGKLFIFNTDGTLQVFALHAEKELIAQSELGAKVTATPAFATGRMYVRTPGYLWCIGN